MPLLDQEAALVLEKGGKEPGNDEQAQYTPAEGRQQACERQDPLGELVEVVQVEKEERGRALEREDP